MKIRSASISLATVTYLAVPVAVFLAGWLHPVPAVSAIALLAVGIVRFARWCERPPGGPCTPVAVHGARMAAGFVPVLVALLMSGAGGVGPQTWDWLKHDALFKDLVAADWPVIYEVGSQRVALVYGIAWYLPAALFAKAGGWDIGYAMLFAWTALGMTLVYTWLVYLTGGAAIAAGMVFVFFSGWDALAAVYHHPDQLQALWGTFDLEHAWMTGWAYPSHYSMLSHAPQHSLGAWLAFCLLAGPCRRGEASGPVVLILAMSAFWSPFTTIALLPFALLVLHAQLAGEGIRALRSLYSPPALAGWATGAVALLYYAARFAAYELPDRYYPPVENRGFGDFFLYPLARPVGEFVANLAEFVFIEFGALALVVLACYRRASRNDPRTPWFLAAVAWLVILPVAHYGIFNDLSMRGSVCALFVVCLAAILMLLEPAAGAMRRALLLAVLLLGASNPLNMLRLDIETVLERRSIWFPRAYESVPGLLPFQVGASRYFNLTDQYLGSPDTAFFRWLAAPSRPTVVE